MKTDIGDQKMKRKDFPGGWGVLAKSWELDPYSQKDRQWFQEYYRVVSGLEYFKELSNGKLMLEWEASDEV